MEVILLKDVESVGSQHEIVTVKNGYGRNFLIPQKLAIIANRGNRARLTELKRQAAVRESNMLVQYKDIAEKLRTTVIKVGAKAGTTGKIFGSVTSAQLAQALKDQLSIDIDRKKIILPDEVKMLGEYTADLQLHPEVKTTLAFEVVQE